MAVRFCLALVVVVVVLALCIIQPSHVAATTTQKAAQMDAKRAFDRVKHHPVVGDSSSSTTEEGEPPLVEYKASDGTIKKMTQAELQARLQAQEGVMPQLKKDGTLHKSEEGKATLEELEEKDPYLARLVQASQFALERLQEEGEVGAGAKLKALHSVEGEDGKDSTIVGANFIMLHLRLTILEQNNDEKQFEVVLEGRDGYGALIKAWRLGPGDSKQAIKLPPPPASQSWEAVLLGELRHFLESWWAGGQYTWSSSSGTVLLLGAGILAVVAGLALTFSAGGGGESAEKKKKKKGQ